jgi:23S rRNA pseudouridine955/2504/2580 synthase
MSETEVRQFTVTSDDDGIRVDRWFKRNLPDARFNTVSRWARTGQLRVDGKRVGPGDRVEAGQTIRVPPADPAGEERPKAKPERPTLSPDETSYIREMVIHEDAAAFVVNKPPGLATQGGTKTNEHLDRLLDGLPGAEANRPKLVHRLDKDTSGALLIARSPRAAAFFSKSFSGRTARKVYWALVVGVPEVRDGFIDLPIGKQFGTGGEKMCVDEEEGQPARTRYRVVERAGNRTAWVELQPHTGRTHQLRVHMEAIGHPIVGDGKYGGQDAYLTGTISRKLHLHARRLRIDHPDGGQVDVVADLPEHFATSLATLGFELAAGDLPLDEVRYGDTPEGKRKAVSAAAKARRKERKGERRSRGRG